jgi:hypothetical protein
MIKRSHQIGRLFLCLMTLCFCNEVLKAEQDSGATASASGSIFSATHVLGFEAIAKNASGSLSIQSDSLQFRKGDASSAEIPIDSIQNLSLGEQDKQVGGVPLALGRAATPFGGGRVISLFSHKKYDTLTVDYLDSNGALHGAVFQLKKGQGQLLQRELEAKGLPAKGSGNDSAKTGAEEAK